MLGGKHALWDQYILDEAIFYGKRTNIWRAHKEDPKEFVILKVTADTHPKNIALLKHEYNLLSKLKHVKGIVHPIEEVYQDNHYGIIFADEHQLLLSKVIKKKTLPVKQALAIMISLVSTVKKLHEIGIIHKDIKPSNILIDKNNQVTLLDFGIAAEITREPQIEELSGKLEGTLSYLSPEQTGRMNRAIDVRSDLYSLGVTFYELLTGQLPFKADDALGMIHAHMTKKAKPPHEVNPAIPIVLSNIVMTLMNKQVSDRYQTAFTLERDLKHCNQELEKQHTIPDFPLRQNDIPAQLTLPLKIYGRDEEINEVLKMFAKVQQGQLEILMVKGDPGVGKTELINECRVRLLNEKCIFLRGKFDQYKKDQALAALSQAFNEFTLQLMALKDEQFQEWRNKLIQAVGPNGRILTDLVPNLSKIIGKQPALAELDPNQSFNRIIYTLQNFIQAIASREEPLVIFLDDLQWADNVTLKWLKELITPSLVKLHHVMIIGSYRPNEAGIEELNYALKAMEGSQAIEYLQVKNLKEEVEQEWLADALYTSKDDVKELARIFYSKTQGNPFHMTALLNSLYIEKVVTFNHLEGKWTWNLEGIKIVAESKNVAELMHYFLKYVPEETQKLLQYAACIGHQFSLNELSYVRGRSQAEMAGLLWYAIKNNIIIPLSANYRIAEAQVNNSDFEVNYQFAHDKIQQAAYQLLSNNERTQTHYQIGKYLDETNTADVREDNIINIANHYNLGMRLVSGDAEKTHVAQINLQAAIRAKASTNYLDGSQYADIGISLLPDDYWREVHQLAYSLFKLRAECAFALGQYPKAVEDIQQLLVNAKTTLDKMQIYHLYTQINTARGHLEDSITQMINGMRLGGLNIPRHPNIFHVLKMFVKYWWHFRKIKIDTLVNRPPTSKPEVLWTIKLFQAGGVALYETDSVNLILIFLLNSLIYVEKEGVSPYSPFPCAAASYLFGGIMGYYKHANDWAEFAKNISERYNDPLMRALFLQSYLHFDFWRQKECTLPSWNQLAESGLQYAQQAGDRILIVDMLSMVAPQQQPLPEQIKFVKNSIPIIKAMQMTSLFQRYLRFFSLKFNEAGETDNPESLSYPEYDSDACYHTWQKEKNYLQLSCCNIAKATIAYRDKNYFRFYKYYMQSAGYFSFGERVEDTYIFAPVSYSHLTKMKEKFRIYFKIWKEYRFLKKLSTYNPDFLPYFHFMQAEFARWYGRKAKAIKLYELAVTEMEVNLNTNKIPAEKLAFMLEAIGEYYLSIKENQKASTYLQRAYGIYQERGFTIRQKLLHDRYNYLQN